MTDHSLPDSGPEREIFLQALSRFSDECEAPNLIAECPFSIDLPGGGRGCGEECLELLDRHGGPPSTGKVGSSGIAAHSMGPRRRPRSDPAHRPFDAAEYFYRDSDTPDRSRWQTSSLLYDLRQAYLPAPASLLDPQRYERLAASADELQKRGFDVDALVRLGLRAQLADALSLAIVMPDLLAARRPQDETEHAPDGATRAQPPAGWSKVLDAFIDAEGSQRQVPCHLMRISSRSPNTGCLWR